MPPSKSLPWSTDAAASGFVRVSDLTVRFGAEREIVAVQDLSLELRRGEFVSVLGPSGCGKSTLLHVIAGFVTPSGGSVSIAESAVQGPSPDYGLVFQEHSLFPWKTVWGNLAFGPRMRGQSKSGVRETVRKLIILLGLSEFEQSYPHELSGGMAQRVSIGRLLASDPSVLLMDEPFGSLDAQTRIDMQELLLKVWEESRKTVLFVTHDIDEALLLSDRVLLMSARPGHILESHSVQLPRPRSADMRFDPRIVELRARIFEVVREQQRRTVAQPAPRGRVE